MAGNISTKKDSTFKRLLIGILDSTTLFSFYKLFNKNLFFIYGNDPSAKYIIKGRVIHKQAAPINEFMGENNFCLLEFGLRSYGTPKIKGTVNISSLFTLFKLLYYVPFYFSYRESDSKLIINNFLKKNGIDTNVWNDIYDFFIKQYFFSFLIKLIRPKKIFLKSFNNTNAMSILYAANKHNIITVDYQHGQQGDNNLSYSNWLNIPKNGYKTLPREFWLWGKEFEYKFQSWICNQDYHKTNIVGNLWFNYVLKNKNLFPPCNALPQKKINVLVCLQKTRLPKIINECFQSDEDKIFWHFRLHPRELHKKSKLESDLKHKKINYDLDIANSYHLESLLQSVDVVITEWSTVAYEATLFKKKSIVIHRNGYDAFLSLILNGDIIYATNHKKLIELIIT